jgi:uncharacterized protein involved in exopolysaccharide biosynthesis
MLMGAEASKSSDHRQATREKWPTVVELVSREKILFISCAAVCLALGTVYLAIAPSRYTAVAELVVDAKQSYRLGSETIPEPPVDVAVIDSQLEIIRSEQIALAVIRTLGLADDREFNKAGVLTQLREEFNRAGLFKYLGAMFGPTGDTETEKLQRVLTEFRRVLQVRRLGRSYVMEIEFTSVSPEKAARIANAVAAGYIRDQLDTRAAQSAQMGSWLQERIKKLREQMSDAFLRVETLKAESSAASRAGQVKLRELEAEAQAYRAIHDAFLNRYVQAIQQQSSPVTEARVVTESIPPIRPTSPKLVLTVVVSIFAGFAVGLLAVFARGHQRRRAGARRPSSPAESSPPIFALRQIVTPESVSTNNN